MIERALVAGAALSIRAAHGDVPCPCAAPPLLGTSEPAGSAVESSSADYRVALDFFAMEVLYVAASGSSDATRASIPWHLAVNGSLEVGQTTGIVLAGDATEVLRADVHERLEAVGIPPMRDLMAKVRDNGIPVFV